MFSESQYLVVIFIIYNICQLMQPVVSYMKNLCYDLSSRNSSTDAEIFLLWLRVNDFSMHLIVSIFHVYSIEQNG